MRRILVFGGRHYPHSNRVWAALDRAQVDALIHGACPSGADHFAARWAEARGVTVEAFPADWMAFGKGAGPKRNREMADADLTGAIGFPGGSGTANMHAELVKRGIPTWWPDGGRP